MPLRVGQFVTFKDPPGASGTIFEFQDDGMVAGLRGTSQKLKDMGCELEQWMRHINMLLRDI